MKAKLIKEKSEIEELAHQYEIAQIWLNQSTYDALVDEMEQESRIKVGEISSFLGIPVFVEPFVPEGVAWLIQIKPDKEVEK